MRVFDSPRRLALVAALLTLASSASVGAQPVASGPLASKAGPWSHVDPVLRTAHTVARRGAAHRQATAVSVDVVASTPDAVAPLVEALERLGFETQGQIGAIVSGRLPVEAIGDAAGLPSVRALLASRAVVQRARGAAPARSPVFVGAVDGEASQALGADIARAQVGVDGSGVRIGVISNSFDVLGQAAGDVASGDLPAGIRVLEDDLTVTTQIDEGRAMMQLAYDVAPGVDFSFHTGTGFVTFAQGIVDLFEDGADIVVDDVSLSIEPFFQDGLIAQAADFVAAEGVPYFSSAGNSANASYEADFAASGQVLDISGTAAGALHDFDVGPGVDAFQDIVLPPGGVLRFAFGYDEPSVAASGEAGSPVFVGAPGQAPTSDYDVFVLAAPSATVDTTDVLAASVFSNAALGLPYEFVEYANATGVEQTVYIAIVQFAGVDRRLKYINFGGTGPALASAEYNGASTTFGHSNAAGAFAVGAAAWFNTAPFNDFIADNAAEAGPAALQGFTAFGGLAVRLDVDGQPIAPDDRRKPDATASDADNNTFFGDDTDIDEDTRPNFGGTSAAAPNLAAVAALMVEAAGGSGTLGSEAVYETLRSTAADLRPGPGYNAATGPGYDIRSGVGFADADSAVAAVAAPACAVGSALAIDALGNDPERGEFVTLVNGGESVRLTGCAFVVVDLEARRVTFAAETSGGLSAGGTYTLATTGGDQALPPETLPDRFGLVALVADSVAVGARLPSLARSLVAAAVYVNPSQIFGRVHSASHARSASHASLEALLDAALEAPTDVAEVDLTVTAVPNPVGDRGQVAFGVAAASDVRVALYDALGREVAVLAEGPLEAGRHHVEVRAGDLPAGVYVVRVAGDGGTRTARWTVVR